MKITEKSDPNEKKDTTSVPQNIKPFKAVLWELSFQKTYQCFSLKQPFGAQLKSCFENLGKIP